MSNGTVFPVWIAREIYLHRLLEEKEMRDDKRRNERRKNKNK
jgi:hypothetical protein